MNNLIATFALILLILIAGLFICFIFAFINNLRLAFYLYKSDHNRWSELTTVGHLPGGNNPFRWFPYLYSDLGNEDEKILRLKTSIRKGIKYSLLFLAAVFLTLMGLIFSINTLS